MASGYQAGSAYSIYALDLSQFDRDVARVKREIAGLQAEAAKARAPVNAPRPSGGSGGDPAKTQAAAERAILSRAAAEARLIQVQNTGENTLRGLTAAEQTYEAALSRVDRTSVAAIRAQTQLTAVRNRAATAQSGGGLDPALPRTVESFGGGAIDQVKSGVLGLLGPAALAATAMAAIGKGMELGKAALDLDQAKRTLQAVAGGQREYEAATRIAREQQVLFGGSLKDNIEGLTGLQITARQSGADLRQLIDLSQRLGTLDPAQGAAGARIALSEALSGDPTSLAKRYEIPKAALAELRDESVSASDKLAIIDQYLNKVGITSAAVAGTISDQAKAYNTLGAEIGDLTTNIGGGLAVAFEAPARGLSRLIGIINSNPTAIAELKALLAGKGAISESDIADIQREQAQKIADAIVRPLETGDNPFASKATRDDPNLNTAIAQGATENAAAVQALREQLLALQLAGGSAAESSAAFGAQLRSGAIDADQFRTYIQALADQQNAGRDIEDQRAISLTNASAAAAAAASGSLNLSDALQTELSSKIAGAQASEQLTQLQSQLDADSKAAAQGLFASGDQALALANKYGIAADAARFLIQQQNALAAKSALAEQRAGERNPGTSGAAEVAAQEERRLQALYRTLQDPPDKPRTGRGGGGLSDQQKFNNSLLADQAKANDRFEDAQIKHEQAILKIEKDFAAKSLDAQKKNESNKRRSRFDFYKSLSKDTATIGKAAADDLSAQYEAAFAESQRLAQAGNQVQAREFLALRKEQIAADQEYYRDRAEAQKEAKDGESKESRKAAEAEIGRLAALRALEKDAQAEDLKQLLEGGDQLQTDKAAALQNENAQYEQAQSKIELASDRATDHKIANALRAGKAIEAENALLVKQGQIYQSLPGGASATNGALPTATDTPAAAGAAAAALMAVVDTALLGAVQAQTSMQVEKFDAMIGRLDAVERAVRSVRGSGGVAG